MKRNILAIIFALAAVVGTIALLHYLMPVELDEELLFWAAK